LIPDNVTADVVTAIPEGVAMTSLSIVGIALAMSQTEVVVIDGGITDYLVDFWHTVEFSRFKRAPAASPFPARPSGQLSYFSGPTPAGQNRRRLPPHPWFSAARPSALSASGTVHVGRDELHPRGAAR
jgi:hypothetical protein